jgi:uncharacterized lipoprotein YbaY
MKTRAFLVIAATSALALSGCATDAPQPSESISAPPSAAATPVAESIVIGGLSFSIEYDTGDPAVFEYASDPAEAIAALTVALGEDPVVTPPGDVTCGAPSTETAWPGFAVYTESVALPPGQQFQVFADATPALPVSASDGSVLGADNASVVDATDDRLKSVSDSDGVFRASLYFDVQDLIDAEVLYSDAGPVSDSDDGLFAWGGNSYAKSGVVQRISAPVYYTDC